MLRIVIDTREQQPWHFPRHLAAVSRGTLSAGDYALEGDRGFAIERKSLPDFVGTISSGWERFRRELERMPAGAARVVIVEGNATQVLRGEYNHPAVQPTFVFKRLAELVMQNVIVLFADNPPMAAGIAYKILKERARQIGIYSDNDDQEGDLPEA